MTASETTPREAAADRRTIATLREACTGGPSPELAARIVQTLCEAPTRRPAPTLRQEPGHRQVAPHHEHTSHHLDTAHCLDTAQRQHTTHRHDTTHRQNTGHLQDTAHRQGARRTRLLAAAALLGGVGAVFATSWAASAPDDTASEAGSQQDPQPNVEHVRITNDDLRSEPGEPHTTGPAWRRAFDIAPQVPLSVVIAGDALEAESPLDLGGTSAREMLERLALEADVGMHRFGRSVLLSRDRPGSLPRAARVTLHHDNLRLVDFAKVLHARCGVSLVVPTDRPARLKIDVDDAPWHAVLEATARAFGLQVAHCGAVVALRDPPPGAIAQRNDWIVGTQKPALVTEVLSSVANAGQYNFAIGEGVVGTVRASIQERTSHGVLEALAAAASSEVRDGGPNIWVFVSRPDVPTTTLTGEHLTLTDFAAYSTRLLAPRTCTDDGPDDRDDDDDGGEATVAVFAGKSPVPDLIHAVAAAAGRTVRRTPQGDYVLE